MSVQYFDHATNKQLAKNEALDERGCLKDGIRCRVTLHDGHRPGFASSGSTFADWSGGDGKRDGKREAYADHQNYLENAWRTPVKLADVKIDEDNGDDDGDEVDCPRCGGDGEVGKGVVCPRCEGEGTISAADAKTRSTDRRRSVTDIAADHKRTMETVYNSYAEELSKAYQNPR